MNMVLAILLRLVGLGVIVYGVFALYEAYGTFEDKDRIVGEFRKQEASYARGGPPGGGGGPPGGGGRGGAPGGGGGGRGGNRGGQSRVRPAFEDTDTAQRLKGEEFQKELERYLWFRTAIGELVLGAVLILFPYAGTRKVVPTFKT
jgi:hypothetical protein